MLEIVVRAIDGHETNRFTLQVRISSSSRASTISFMAVASNRKDNDENTPAARSKHVPHKFNLPRF